MIYKTILEICSRCLAEPRLYSESTLEQTIDELNEGEMNSLGRDVISLKYILARKEAFIHLHQQERLLHNSGRADFQFLAIIFISGIMAILISLLSAPTAMTRVFDLLIKFAFGFGTLSYGISAFLTSIFIEKQEERRQLKMRQIEKICTKMKRSRERVMSRKVHTRHEEILNTLKEQIAIGNEKMPVEKLHNCNP